MCSWVWPCSSPSWPSARSATRCWASAHSTPSIRRSRRSARSVSASSSEPTDSFKWFTIVLVLGGVGTALYTLSVLLETVVEGRLTDRIGRRRMERKMTEMTGHVIICGWGRVGRSIAAFVAGAGGEVVIVERDPVAGREDRSPVRRSAMPPTTTSLERAGIDRAATLIAALNTDADNLFVTLSGRSRRPDLFIVARARVEGSEAKLLQAGANRVVNPQQIGGARMGALATQPNVAEFLDVVMHDGSLEFRLAEVPVSEGRRSMAPPCARPTSGTRPGPSSWPSGRVTAASTPTRHRRPRSSGARCSSRWAPSRSWTDFARSAAEPTARRANR